MYLSAKTEYIRFKFLLRNNDNAIDGFMQLFFILFLQNGNRSFLAQIQIGIICADPACCLNVNVDRGLIVDNPGMNVRPNL
ncbi:hypothetical protein D3C74_431300 [compost metagenome]